MSLDDTSFPNRDEPSRLAAVEPAVSTPRRPGPDAEPRRGDCILTSKDSALLDVWLMRSADCELEIDPVLCALVRAKLAAARIVLSDDIEPDRARGGSRVVYSVDGGPPMSHLLAHWRHDTAAETILPVTSIPGITLLGMRAGQRMPFVRSDGSWGSVRLEAVLPPADVAAGTRDGSAQTGPAFPPTPQKIVPFRPAARRKPSEPRAPAGPDDPVPGPAAA